MEQIRKVISVIRRLWNNRTVRVNLSLMGGMLINCSYIAANFASATIYSNSWSATVTLYHLTLMAARIYMLTAIRSTMAGQGDKICLRVGLLLLFLDLTSAAMMIYTLRRQSFTTYSGLILFCLSVYAVYSVSSSAIAVINHRKDNNKLHLAAKSISLSTALMSVFNLQYSLLFFLGADVRLVWRAIALGGVVVFSVMLALSLRLIIRALSTVR